MRAAKQKQLKSTLLSVAHYIKKSNDFYFKNNRAVVFHFKKSHKWFKKNQYLKNVIDICLSLLLHTWSDMDTPSMRRPPRASYEKRIFEDGKE